jgi:hypothetical protein
MRTNNLPDSVRHCSNAIQQNLVNVLAAVSHATQLAMVAPPKRDPMRHGPRRHRYAIYKP